MKLEDAFRIANRYANVETAKKFTQHVVPEVVKPARIIWNQAIGGVFLLFAVSFIWYAIRNSRNAPGLIFGLFLGAIMAFFCVSSFLKARRISRR